MSDTTTLIKQRFGEFLPEGVDPGLVYNQWVKSIFGGESPDQSMMYFVLSQAKAAGIDPRVPRQIYALPFKNNKTGATNYTIVVGIEGLVTIAERTGQYGGTTKPEYETKADGTVESCTIGVHKVVQGVPMTSYQTVYMNEYFVPGRDYNGKHSPSMWEQKPKTMIKKVALAHALRATFSACAGMYVQEEMDREANVVEAEIVPDIAALINNAKNANELSAVINTLPEEEKKKASSLAIQRLKELNKETTNEG